MAWMDLLRTYDFKLPITSLEVLHACLCLKPGGEKNLRSQNPHAFATFRDPSFCKDVRPDHQWIFENEHIHKSDPRASGPQSKQYIIWDDEETYKIVMRDFKEMDRGLRLATHSCVCVDYEVTGAETTITGGGGDWKYFGFGRVTGLESFAKKLQEALRASIYTEFHPLEAPDERSQEAVQHEVAVEERSRDLVGRDKEVEHLLEFGREAHEHEREGITRKQEIIQLFMHTDDDHSGTVAGDELKSVLHEGDFVFHDIEMISLLQATGHGGFLTMQQFLDCFEGVATHDEQARALVVWGQPGCGKSALLSSVIFTMLEDGEKRLEAHRQVCQCNSSIDHG